MQRSQNFKYIEYVGDILSSLYSRETINIVDCPRWFFIFYCNLQLNNVKVESNTSIRYLNSFFFYFEHKLSIFNAIFIFLGAFLHSKYTYVRDIFFYILNTLNYFFRIPCNFLKNPIFLGRFFDFIWFSSKLKLTIFHFYLHSPI